MRYVALNPITGDVDHINVKIRLLIKYEHHDVDQLFIHLHKLNSITLTLQENGTTLQRARKQFDGVSIKFGKPKDRLADYATIMNNVQFKCAIFKILSWTEHSLSMAQERSNQHLRAVPTSVSVKNELLPSLMPALGAEIKTLDETSLAYVTESM